MRPDVHLEPGCPWWTLSELRLPNVDWCETQRCAWVVEPANAWSNLAYVFVALVLYGLSRRSSSAHLRFFAPATLVVGIASGIYHASYTFVLQILDFFGMYLFIGLLLTLTLRRAGLLDADSWHRRLWQGVLAATGLTVAVDFLGVPIQSLVLLLIVAVVAAELWLAQPRRNFAGSTLRYFAAGIVLICAGGIFSLLDVTRAWCLPDHAWLQGHAIWHVLTSLSLLACYFHYRQFEGELGVGELGVEEHGQTREALWGGRPMKTRRGFLKLLATVIALATPVPAVAHPGRRNHRHGVVRRHRRRLRRRIRRRARWLSRRGRRVLIVPVGLAADTELLVDGDVLVVREVHEKRVVVEREDGTSESIEAVYEGDGDAVEVE